MGTFHHCISFYKNHFVLLASENEEDVSSYQTVTQSKTFTTLTNIRQPCTMFDPRANLLNYKSFYFPNINVRKNGII